MGMENGQHVLPGRFDLIESPQLRARVHAKPHLAFGGIFYRQHKFHDAVFSGQQSAGFKWRFVGHVTAHGVQVSGVQAKGMIDHVRTICAADQNKTSTTPASTPARREVISSPRLMARPVRAYMVPSRINPYWMGPNGQ